ncbi:RHS repeat-associated protein [Kitasatospora gansuensis]|uniref:RHS repeat-associated protein n=1 Tax=Kitasatospora gansuensis TaxID=258050 RepID=A0A7W7WJM1_9ACTN|nr:DUF6531 domain-containing protein [Kitasatospora gansuensis]MBB4949095.1 RHS repeat-associated protein [Kitasatospora gansuensis]
MSDGFKHDPDSMESLAKKFDRHSDDLADSHRKHHGKARAAFGRTRGKGGLASAAEQGIGQLMDVMEQGQKALRKHLKDMGTGLRQTSANHKATEQRIVDALKGKDGGRDPGRSPGKGNGSGNGPGGRPGPRRLRDNVAEPRKVAVPPSRRKCRSDPIDIATGEMLLEHEDVRLPGVLPLILRRTHLSSYRSGGWFGPSWASTLDQCLELDAEGVVFAAEDGTLLVYPAPEPGESVLPLEGSRLPLRRTDSGYRIGLPGSGQVLHFDGPESAAADGVRLPLREITDRNGNRIEVVRSAAGVPVELRHSGGYRVAVEVTGRRITGYRLVGAGAADDPRGAFLAAFRYDGNGNLSEILDAADRPLRLGYDEAGRITSWTDRNQFRYRYLYDRAGRCVQTRGDSGSLDAVFGYDPANRLTTVRDSLGRVTVYQLNELGQTVTETDPSGAVVRSEWDRYDRLRSRTDELGRTTSYEYDVDGNPASVTLPDGALATAVFDRHGKPLQATQPDGTVWRYEYDERGNLLLAVDPMGAETRCSYGDLGHLRSVTDALGGTTRYTTDAAGLVLSSTDPLGAVSTCTRDALGRLATATDAVGGVTSYGWTDDSLPAWRTDPEGRTERWSYDPRGDLTEYLNADGRATRFEYGPFGTTKARTGPDGTRYEFRHDTELRLAEVVNPKGLRWSYEFGPAGELLSETDFNGRTVRYVSDAAGQLTERTNGAGQSVTFIRDAAGRVVASRADGGAQTSFEYDPAGRLVRSLGTDCTVEFSHDPAGRIIAETVDGHRTTSEYDLLGRQVRRTTPTGAVSRWSYDANGLPTALSTVGGEFTFGYDPLGRETARHFGGAVALTQSWDGSHRLVGQALWRADEGVEGTGYRQLQGRGYGYRADGHPEMVTDQLGGDRRLELDPAGRVTAVRAEHWSESYAYDALGNLAGASFPGRDDSGQGEREHEGTLVRRAGRTTYRHDGQGRVVQAVRRTLSGREREWRYSWDAEDRLVQAVTPDGAVWRYRYDVLGRRVGKTRLADDGRVVEHTRFSWDGTTLAEQCTTSPGSERAVTWDWEPEGYRAVSQLDRSWRIEGTERTETDRRFHGIVTDLVGAPAELVTAEGEIAWRAVGTLWGHRSGAPGAMADCPLRFPGQYHDAETGLHYNLARYYDADTASYLSPDPLGLAAAPNHHGYVGNPLWWADPLGLKGKKIRRVYDDSEYDKHGSSSGSSGKGEVSRAPSNGQAALDRSIDMDPDNPNVTRRLGVDHENDEIVVLDRHREISDPHGNVTEYYHGHVQSKYPSKSVTQGDLTKLKKAGMIDNIKKQRVLPPPPCES